MSARRLTTSPAKSDLLTSRQPSESSVSETAQAVLAEMFELLEEYGPLWYTEDLHTRAARVLAQLGKPGTFTLIEGRGSEKRVN
jgi:hypothetical protein